MTVKQPRVSQVTALQVSESSTHAMSDETDRSFSVRHSPEDSPNSFSALKKLQELLDRKDVPALVHKLRNVYLQSTHWMVSVQGELVSDTRYLIHEQYLLRNFDMIRRNEAITLDPSRIWILAANYAPGNYWHWHAQSLPAIIHAIETIPPSDFHRVSILTGKLTTWQRDGLSALGFGPDQIQEMERGITLHIDRLLYSDLLSSRQVFGLNHARRRTTDLLKTAARIAHPVLDQGLGRRLYISRGDSGRRPLLNEEQLRDGLERLGFVPIVNTNMSLLKQVRIYQDADIVVAPHGAGSTNMLFMESCKIFVEFQQESHVNAGPISLGKTSKIIPYVSVFNDDGKGQATEGWNVDINNSIRLVEMALGD